MSVVMIHQTKHTTLSLLSYNHAFKYVMRFFSMCNLALLLCNILSQNGATKD